MSVLSFGLYFFFSSVAMCANLSYACYTREQFYPIVLFLVTSKVSFLITANMVVALTGLVGKLMKSIFFGKLRDSEVEQLVDRLRYSVAETGLALTTFRAELSPVVLLIFLLLIYVKSFHWLCRSRIDYLEQVVPVPLLPHVRIQALLFSLLCLDLGVFYYCAVTTMASGKSVLILFGFEFVVLFISAINSSIRYLLILADSYYAAGLHYKGFYTMLLDVISDGLRFVVYVAFFSLIFIHYDLPIHIIREVWISFLAFQQRLVSLYRYLRITRRLDDRLPEASEQELAAAGDCLICREGMTKGKKLSCSHVFHADCLRMWLQHQQSCPLCRSDIQIPSDAATPPAPAGDDAAAVAQGVGAAVADGREPRRDIDGAAGARPMAATPEPNVAAAGGRVDPPLRRTLRAAATPAAEPAAASSEYSVFSSRVSPLLATDVPGFFQVLTNQYVIVRTAPNITSPQCAIIPEGTVVFCSTRLTPLEGHLERWLRVPEGWIPERNACTLELNVRPITVDDVMSAAGKASPSKASVTSLEAADATLREPAKHHSNKMQSRSDRAQLVLELQARVESMGLAMLQMQESLAATQLSLLQLAQNDIAQSEVMGHIAPSPSVATGAGVTSEAKVPVPVNALEDRAAETASALNVTGLKVPSTGSPAVASAERERKPPTDSPVRELRSQYFSKLASAPTKKGDGDAGADRDQK